MKGSKTIFAQITIILGVALFVFSSCSDGDSRETLDCSPTVGTSCYATSSGSIEIPAESLKRASEYVVVVMSRASAQNPNSLEHNISLQTDIPSGPIPTSEARDIAQVLRTQRGTFGSASPMDYMINTPIAPTYFQQNISLGETIELYLPNPDDFTGKTPENEIIPLYTQMPNGRVLSGARTEYQEIAKRPGSFALVLNTRDFGRYDDVSEDKKSFLSDLDQCLERVIPSTTEMIGKPLFNIDGRPEIKVAVTKFPNDNGSTSGLFSPFDRFVRDGNLDMDYGNKTQIVYISLSDFSSACSNAAHETQHMINFDYKVLRHLSPPFNVRDINRFPAERLGLNEAYSHVIEELSGEQQIVAQHIYNFWTNPNQATFALESVGMKNVTLNSRSRGLNTLLLYFAIQKAGGTLKRSQTGKIDPVTASLLKALIQSPDIGFENMAKLFHLEESELLKEFFTHLAVSLYNNQQGSGFIPALENENGHTRGISLMPRTAPISDIEFKPPTLHPYQFDLQPLTDSDDMSLNSEGLLFYRYIVPSEISAKSKIRFRSDGTPFSVFLIAVR